MIGQIMRCRHCGGGADCAEKILLFFGTKRENVGTVGVWSTALGDGAIATAGLTEGMATERGYDVVAVTIEGPNRHPGIMPGAANTKDKLVIVNAAEMAVSEMRRPYTDGG